MREGVSDATDRSSAISGVSWRWPRRSILKGRARARVASGHVGCGPPPYYGSTSSWLIRLTPARRCPATLTISARTRITHCCHKSTHLLLPHRSTKLTTNFDIAQPTNMSTGTNSEVVLMVCLELHPEHKDEVRVAYYSNAAALVGVASLPCLRSPVGGDLTAPPCPLWPCPLCSANSPLFDYELRSGCSSSLHSSTLSETASRTPSPITCTTTTRTPTKCGCTNGQPLSRSDIPIADAVFLDAANTAADLIILQCVYVYRSLMVTAHVRRCAVLCFAVWQIRERARVARGTRKERDVPQSVLAEQRAALLEERADQFHDGSRDGIPKSMTSRAGRGIRLTKGDSVGGAAAGVLLHNTQQWCWAANVLQSSLLLNIESTFITDCRPCCYPSVACTQHGCVQSENCYCPRYRRPYHQPPANYSTHPHPHRHPPPTPPHPRPHPRPARPQSPLRSCRASRARRWR